MQGIIGGFVYEHVPPGETSKSHLEKGDKGGFEKKEGTFSSHVTEGCNFRISEGLFITKGYSLVIHIAIAHGPCHWMIFMDFSLDFSLVNVPWQTAQ